MEPMLLCIVKKNNKKSSKHFIVHIFPLDKIPSYFSHAVSCLTLQGLTYEIIAVKLNVFDLTVY